MGNECAARPKQLPCIYVELSKTRSALCHFHSYSSRFEGILDCANNSVKIKKLKIVNENSTKIMIFKLVQDNEKVVLF
jgi:hypothetical protein